MPRVLSAILIAAAVLGLNTARAVSMTSDTGELVRALLDELGQSEFSQSRCMLSPVFANDKRHVIASADGTFAPGDRILAIDGHTLSDTSKRPVHDILVGYAPDATLTVRILRAEHEVDVTAACTDSASYYALLRNGANAAIAGDATTCADRLREAADQHPLGSVWLLVAFYCKEEAGSLSATERAQEYFEAFDEAILENKFSPDALQNKRFEIDAAEQTLRDKDGAPNLAAQLQRDYEEASLAAVPAGVLLKQAASGGNVSWVKRLLAQEVDAASIDEALSVASGDMVHDDSDTIVEMLLGAGADPNNTRLYHMTPLQAAHRGRTIEVLLAHGARLDPSDAKAMMEAACSPYMGGDPIAVTQVYMGHGVDINAQAPGGRLLHCASRQNMLAYARFLLDHGAAVDARDAEDTTPLCHAGGAEMVALLLARGADVKATVMKGRMSPVTFVLSYMYMGEQENFRGWERLHHRDTSPLNQTLTARHVQLEVMEALLKGGADPNQNGPLTVAVMGGDEASAALLLAHGADVNAGAIPALRYALSEDLRKRLIVAGATQEPDSFRLDDRELCETVAIRANDGRIGDLGLEDTAAAVPHDPSENWNGDFDEVSSFEQALHFQGHTYYLGMDDGPRYVARIGVDGVAQLACEFSRADKHGKPTYQVLSDLDVIRNWASRTSRSPSEYVVTHPGLAAADVLMRAVKGSRGSLTVDSWSRPNRDVLSDAIDAHRRDLLRFWLEQGVDPNLKPRASGADDMAQPGDEFGASRSPLYSAVIHGTAQDVTLLLSYGADPNKTVSELDGRHNQQGPLVEAFVMEDPAKVVALIAHGADLTYPERFNAALDTIPEAARIVRAGDCPTSTDALSTPECLPNALKRADQALNRVYEAELANDSPKNGRLRKHQRAWLERRDHACMVSYRWPDIGGWYAYVLDSPPRAACVLRMTEERNAAILRLAVDRP